LESALETIGLWLAGALRDELARAGGFCLQLLTWLAGVNRQAFEALSNPLAVWLVLLSLLTLRALVSRPPSVHVRRPNRGVR
jgi:hypothetical protein